MGLTSPLFFVNSCFLFVNLSILKNNRPIAARVPGQEVINCILYNFFIYDMRHKSCFQLFRFACKSMLMLLKNQMSYYIWPHDHQKTINFAERTYIKYINWTPLNFPNGRMTSTTYSNTITHVNKLSHRKYTKFMHVKIQPRSQGFEGLAGQETRKLWSRAVTWLEICLTFGNILSRGFT